MPGIALDATCVNQCYPYSVSKVAVKIPTISMQDFSGPEVLSNQLGSQLIHSQAGISTS